MSESRQIAVYFDPASRHFLGDRLFDVTHARYGGDQLLAPYVYLKERLNRRGIEIRTADYLPAVPDGKQNLYVSSGNLSRYRDLARRPDVTLSGFFAMECPTVEPSIYRELYYAQNFFKRVFSWSDTASLRAFTGGPLRCLPMQWPQSFDDVHEDIWRQTDRDGFLVMINGNKIPRYKAPCRELYSERLRAIEFFGRTGEIDLFGIGWDGPSYKVGTAYVPGTFGKVPLPGTLQAIAYKARTLRQRFFPEPGLAAAQKVYKGKAASKAKTLGRYKFALCFENSVLKGWITEKIFDCFFAGVVPVYWGAPDVLDWIPGDCFIDMRDFKDLGELRTFLKTRTGRDMDRYKENARAFLASTAFKPFSREAFAGIFDRIIEEDTGLTTSGLNYTSALSHTSGPGHKAQCFPPR
ncbi:MAG: glycosyltransferase family 10 [Terriglobia bacterium]